MKWKTSLRPQALAQKIRELAENSALAEKLSGQAFAEVKKYSWEKGAEELTNLILRLSV